MIVTCPSCNARYKVDEAKIHGRGAKITCPKCSHKFVVYRENEAAEAVDPSLLIAPAEGEAPERLPDDLPRRDFRRFGIVWQARKGTGRTLEFYDLAKLQELMHEKLLDEGDALSFDGKEWKPLREIVSLERHFLDVWLRAEGGELEATPRKTDDEDESDAPTTVISQGTQLSEEIRRIVQEIATDPPATARGPNGTPIPSATAPTAHARETVPENETQSEAPPATPVPPLPAPPNRQKPIAIAVGAAVLLLIVGYAALSLFS